MLVALDEVGVWRENPLQVLRAKEESCAVLEALVYNQRGN